MQFQISLPLRFRLLGENIWHDAWADSMSATEIVFRGGEVMEIGKTIHIRLVLPLPGIGRHGGTIVSKATVMQSWPLSTHPVQAIIAAALKRPRLFRSGSDNRSDQGAVRAGNNRKRAGLQPREKPV